MMNPLCRRSVRDLSPWGKVVAYASMVAWALVVLFPLYWLFITSFKLPVQVNSGPSYLPLIDFETTLENWRYFLFDLRDETVRPLVNTIIVGISSALLSLILGSLAAYGL